MKLGTVYNVCTAYFASTAHTCTVNTVLTALEQ